MGKFKTIQIALFSAIMTISSAIFADELTYQKPHKAFKLLIDFGLTYDGEDLYTEVV